MNIDREIRRSGSKKRREDGQETKSDCLNSSSGDITHSELISRAARAFVNAHVLTEIVVSAESLVATWHRTFMR